MGGQGCQAALQAGLWSIPERFIGPRNRDGLIDGTFGRSRGPMGFLGPNKGIGRRVPVVFGGFGALWWLEVIHGGYGLFLSFASSKVGRMYCMGFREDWQAWHEQEAGVFRQTIDQARERWQGRRVWVWMTLAAPGSSSPGVPVSAFAFVSPRADWVYGQVESVDEVGRVQVLRGYDGQGQALYWWGSLQDLGQTVVLAEA